MHVQRYVVTLTTDASGNATGYTPATSGRVLNLIYVKDGTTPFADGVDFDVTAEATGQIIWDQDNVNASATVCPKQPTHAPAGSKSSYALAGEDVLEMICIANDRVKIAVANGGDTKVGTFHVVIA